MTSLPLIAVAHGTRDPQGPAVLEELLSVVRAHLPGVDVHIAYVDVIGPELVDVLQGSSGKAVVVPLFLASGYHVRVDVPYAVTATGERAIVTPALGPDEAVVNAVAARLLEAGQLPDAVVMAAAGSSDADAMAEVEAAGRALGKVLDREVVAAYVTTASPTVPEAVVHARASGHATVGIASYLLAPGLFQQRLHEAGADLVGASIGPHPEVATLVVSRYNAAVGGVGRAD